MITQSMSHFDVHHVATYWRKALVLLRQRKAIPSIFEPNILGYTILFFCCLNFLSVHGFEHSNISYIDECRADCARQRDPITCGKFRAVQWLHNFTSDKDIHYGSLRFIRLSAATEGAVLPEFPKLKGFGRYSRFLNFVRSSVEDLLTQRAVVYTIEQSVSKRSLSSGPLILDTDELDEFVELGRSATDDRGLHKKKKKTLSVVLPLLILLKVFKLKLLLIPILIGVHFIKKILLLGALAISSILSNLKYCKIPPMSHHPTAYNTWATAAEAPIDFSIAPGHEDDGWNQKIDMGYGTVGAHDSLVANSQRNAYRGYYQALKQRQLQNMM